MSFASASVSPDNPEGWYFSYGANMSPAVLAGRGVEVRESLPGRLRGWRMRFDYIGYEGVEPRFANLAPTSADAECPAHGVAHALGPGALAVLDDIEDEGVSYARRLIDFEGYSGRRVTAWAYIGMPAWVADEPGLPSSRYLRILSRGAAQHGLSDAYLAWLASQPCLDFHATAQSLAAEAPGLAPPAPPGNQRLAGGPIDYWHRPGDTDPSACEVLRIAGESFYVPKSALAQRSFLRHMVRDGGEAHVLKLLGLAHPKGVEESALPASEPDGAQLSQLQRDYLACWVGYCRAHFSLAE